MRAEITHPMLAKVVSNIPRYDIALHRGETYDIAEIQAFPGGCRDTDEYVCSVDDVIDSRVGP